eukprot:Skav223931  [mRNA]  locus=scaffold2593:496937:497191:+ [translate_table: standard]
MHYWSWRRPVRLKPSTSMSIHHPPVAMSVHRHPPVTPPVTPPELPRRQIYDPTLKQFLVSHRNGVVNDEDTEGRLGAWVGAGSQ